MLYWYVDKGEHYGRNVILHFERHLHGPLRVGHGSTPLLEQELALARRLRNGWRTL